jgi:hypothetical protein
MQSITKTPTDQMLSHRSIHVRPFKSTHRLHAATEAEQRTSCSRRLYLALTATALAGLQLAGQAARPAAGAALQQDGWCQTCLTRPLGAVASSGNALLPKVVPSCTSPCASTIAAVAVWPGLTLLNGIVAPQTPSRTFATVARTAQSLAAAVAGLWLCPAGSATDTSNPHYTDYTAQARNLQQHLNYR